MNLKNLNLQEMNMQELKSTEGGLALPWQISIALWVYDNWDDITKGNQRFKDTH